MKALFTDLDGTVVFSTRTAGPAGTAGLRPIEQLNGRASSFMTPVAHRLAGQLVAAGALVPVTTRTVGQLRRLDLFGQAGTAISDNGAQVLIDGRPDPVWAEHIAGLIPADLTDRHRRVSDDLAGRGWNVHSTGFMLYAVAPQGASPEEFRAVGRSWSWPGMTTHLHRGRKVYWIPDGISKGAAARYTAELTGRRIIVAAGDEALDLSLLALADHALTLIGTGICDQIPTCMQPGAAGGEQILAYAAGLVDLPAAIAASLPSVKES